MRNQFIVKNYNFNKKCNHGRVKWAGYSLIFVLSFCGCLHLGKKPIGEIDQEEKRIEMKVGKITFEGNKVFSEKTLKKRMITKAGGRFDDFVLEQDIKKIIAFYRRNGYLDAEFIGKEGKINLAEKKIDYHLKIEEGEQIKIHSISFAGNEVISDEEIWSLMKVKPAEPINLSLVSLSSYSILSLYAEKGYLYATVSDTVIREEKSNEADILYQITEGNQVRLEKIIITGNEKVRSKIIERELTLKEGDVFNTKKVYESQQKIYALGLFTDVNLQGESSALDAKKDTVDLLVKVKEDKLRWIGGGFGYQSPDRIQISLEWGHDNLFGNHQQLTLKSSIAYSLQEIEKKHEYDNEYSLYYLEPYFLGSRLKAGGHLYHRRENKKENNGEWIKINRTGGDGKLGRTIGKNVQTFVGYKYEYIAQENQVSSLFFSISYDSRRDPFNPLSGAKNFLTLETAGNKLGGTNDFHKMLIESAWFFTPGKKALTFAVHTKGGAIVTFGRTQTVPLQEQFELGGANSLRGYRENEIRADISAKDNYLLNSNLELRYLLPFKLPMPPLSFSLAAFVDGGNIWGSLSDVSFTTSQYGGGMGLRVITPIGPIRVDSGLRLHRKMSKKDLRIYLNLGHAF
ncbi:MAG: BamA/TamA family outer membrane protein [Candidatus Edwardsbacteria bacterium]